MTPRKRQGKEDGGSTLNGDVFSDRELRERKRETHTETDRQTDRTSPQRWSPRERRGDEE